MRMCLLIWIMILKVCAASELKEISDLNQIKIENKKADLYSFSPSNSKDKKKVLIFIHGLKGHPKDFEYMINQVKDSNYKIYIYAYDSFNTRATVNGKQLADVLYKNFKEDLKEKDKVLVIAHSLGGIVTRHALNELMKLDYKDDNNFSSIQTFSIDTPWHGFKGLSDHGIEKYIMNVVSIGIPNGFLDMRAEADCFLEDESKKKKSFLSVPLPPSYSMEMVFAKQGHNALDYTESYLKDLPGKILKNYQDDTPVTGNPQELNFWRALKSSNQFHEFSLSLRKAKDEKKLDEQFVINSLEKYFPRFNGDHNGVLNDPELVKFLKQKYP